MTFWTFNGFCQYDSSYVVKDLLIQNDELNCYFGETEYIKGKTPNHADSLVYCTTFKLYKTSLKDLYYMKYFNQDGQIHSEGTVLIEKYKSRRFFGRKKNSYPRIGLWKAYDYKSSAVKYFDYYYDNSPGCGVVTIIEVKREKIAN